MSFDIYGNNLMSGHCEVHPFVHESYPCSICIREASEFHHLKIAEDQMYQEMAREQDEAIEREYFADMLDEYCPGLA